MKFNLQIWRNYYDNVQKMGELLKNSKPDEDGNPPINELSYDAKKALESSIKTLCEKCSGYLDQTATMPKHPLWIFNIDDETTWFSSEKFDYAHLLR
jgi:hypothetical protein